jgi:hypothetical protein
MCTSHTVLSTQSCLWCLISLYASWLGTHFVLTNRVRWKLSHTIFIWWAISGGRLQTVLYLWNIDINGMHMSFVMARLYDEDLQKVRSVLVMGAKWKVVCITLYPIIRASSIATANFCALKLFYNAELAVCTTTRWYISNVSTFPSTFLKDLLRNLIILG